MPSLNSKEDESLHLGSFAEDETEKNNKKGQVLSQNEINQLLTAINTGDTEPEDSRLAADGRIIKIYDFKRPDKFSGEQIRTIEIMHDTFARLTTTSLSAQLRSAVQVRVASVDQLTYGEFIRSIPTPTTLSIINMDPLRGNAILEIDPLITFSIIERVCGGFGNGTKFQHELTDVESAIMEGIIIRILGNMREAWTQVIDLRPRLGQIDTNPEFAQIVPSTDMVLLVTLETKIGEVEGMINFCVPYLTIEPLIGKISTQFWFSINRDKTPITISDVLLEDIPVRLSAEVLRRDYPINEILKWDIGTIILPLRPLSPGYCYLRLGDRRVWQCQILPNCKWFPKRIAIVNYTEKPFGTEGNMEMEKVNPLVRDALSRAMMKITVELGATFHTVKEVSSMGEGTIVELNKLAGEPLDVKANGVLIGYGEAVVIDENFGVRITEILQPAPEPPAPQMSKKAFPELDEDSFKEALEKTIKESTSEESRTELNEEELQKIDEAAKRCFDD
jgi:flagellar motor switch protein FliM